MVKKISCCREVTISGGLTVVLKLINNSKTEIKYTKKINVWKSNDKPFIFASLKFFLVKSTCLRSNMKHSTQCFNFEVIRLQQ